MTNDIEILTRHGASWMTREPDLFLAALSLFARWATK